MNGYQNSLDLHQIHLCSCQYHISKYIYVGITITLQYTLIVKNTVCFGQYQIMIYLKWWIFLKITFLLMNLLIVNMGITVFNWQLLIIIIRWFRYYCLEELIYIIKINGGIPRFIWLLLIKIIRLLIRLWKTGLIPWFRICMGLVVWIKQKILAVLNSLYRNIKRQREISQDFESNYNFNKNWKINFGSKYQKWRYIQVKFNLI